MSKTLSYKECRVHGCLRVGMKHHRNGRRYYVKGYCSSHYKNFLYRGDPLVYPTRKQRVRSTEEHSPKNVLGPTWTAMVRRCTKDSDQSYSKYGGRGIEVCDRWLGEYGFKNFCDDMGRRPDGYTLDRIDNDGNYEPSNCRWATRVEQSLNRRCMVGRENLVGVRRSRSGRYAAIYSRGPYCPPRGKSKYLGTFDTPEEARATFLEFDRVVNQPLI